MVEKLTHAPMKYWEANECQEATESAKNLCCTIQHLMDQVKEYDPRQIQCGHWELVKDYAELLWQLIDREQDYGSILLKYENKKYYECFDGEEE